jgi:hypothetical protein
MQADLQLVVFLLELPAELFQLLLKGHRLVELVPAVVFVLLQLVPAFLVLNTFALMPLHLGQEVGTSFREVLNLLDIAHFGRLRMQLPVRFPNLPLCNPISHQIPNQVSDLHCVLQVLLKGMAGYTPISASWSFSPAASSSSCEIRCAINLDASVGSGAFFCFPFFPGTAAGGAGFGRLS